MENKRKKEILDRLSSTQQIQNTDNILFNAKLEESEKKVEMSEPQLKSSLNNVSKDYLLKLIFT